VVRTEAHSSISWASFWRSFEWFYDCIINFIYLMMIFDFDFGGWSISSCTRASVEPIVHLSDDNEGDIFKQWSKWFLGFFIISMKCFMPFWEISAVDYGNLAQNYLRTKIFWMNCYILQTFGQYKRGGIYLIMNLHTKFQFSLYRYTGIIFHMDIASVANLKVFIFLLYIFLPLRR
jgi:hypothetical protein